jgi:hypothetical protein
MLMLMRWRSQKALPMPAPHLLATHVRTREGPASNSVLSEMAAFTVSMSLPAVKAVAMGRKAAPARAAAPRNVRAAAGKVNVPPRTPRAAASATARRWVAPRALRLVAGRRCGSRRPGRRVGPRPFRGYTKGGVPEHGARVSAPTAARPAPLAARTASEQRARRLSGAPRGARDRFQPWLAGVCPAQARRLSTCPTHARDLRPRPMALRPLARDSDARAAAFFRRLRPP